MLATLTEYGMGCIAFRALAQGLLTDKDLGGIPVDARLHRPGGGSLRQEHLSEQDLLRVTALNAVALSREQSLAQMELARVVRDQRITSALIGASRP